jgi:hypothetical protein
MGREANCVCNWNGAPARVKALVEPPDLILRGEIRRRMPLTQLRQVRADHGVLRFTFGEDDVALILDAAAAQKWVKVILTPAPSLAKKLGIAAESAVWVIGEIDHAALEKAIGEAGVVGRKDANVILARVNTPAELSRAFQSANKETSNGVPIWIIYQKGPGHPINESDVRGAGLAAGIVDVKVASVSAELTALKFVKRKNPKPSKRR